MSESELSGLTQQVLWAAFVLGLVFGAIAQRSHFCTMGALADVLSMGDWGRMRMWALAAAVAMLGFNALVVSGAVRAADTFYAGPVLPWLSLLVGGLMFGMGMVLASGCGSKTLVRLGGGSLKALIVMLVMGLTAWATLRGVGALLRNRTLDTVTWAVQPAQDLPTLVAAQAGGSASGWAGLLGALLGLALLAWVLYRPEGRRKEVLLGGLGIGAAVVGLWWVSGVMGQVAEHPQTLEQAFLATNSQRMESFSFVAPVAYLMQYLVFASDTSQRLTQGVVAALGVVLGSGVVALATRQFRWEGFSNVADLARHLLGAVLMGFGGVTALGCTIGQGLSGLSTLSLGSLLALAGIMAGGVACLRWQIWQLERQL